MGMLENMINAGEIQLDQLLTMHPFSASEKKLYDLALQDIDFLKELYIKNNKTYERLAVVCNVINNRLKNLTVITGYRGCGKTNFLQLIKYISDGGKDLETIEELRNRNLNYAKNIEDLRNIINEGYQESIKKIGYIFPNMRKMDDQTISDTFIDYISEKLSGKCQYINFDEGGMGRKKPFSKKLHYIIKRSVNNLRKTDKLHEILEAVDAFLTRNWWDIEESFEEIESPALEQFWKVVREHLHLWQKEEFDSKFLPELTKLSLEQLLFFYTIWEYAEIIVLGRAEKERKLIYLLDNIDIIAEETTDIFKNTMMGIWKFVWDTHNVFDKIRKANQEADREFIALYDKTNMVVAMRETTAMHISSHLRDRMHQLLDHFDMSEDVDKAEVMQRKIDFVLSMIRKGKIVNEGFMEDVDCLNQLMSDRLFMRNLFRLFNNDYRASVRCISTICIENKPAIEKAIRLIHSDNASLVFGGRGIVYRIILDKFFGWGYFAHLGITSKTSNVHNVYNVSQQYYSCARIILTVLCNKQGKKHERFFINTHESVKLADLYNLLQGLMEEDEFVSLIDGMYELRDKKFWNHLVTFDNILFYSPNVIRDYVGLKNFKREENTIYIRATLAGQMFASVICTHFEYFASRFASVGPMGGNVSLFMLDNLDDINQWNTMQTIITDVYGAVRKCTAKLECYNRKVLKITGKAHYDKIIDNEYYWEGRFHEERIIHNHISYLEAYRYFVFKTNISENKLSEANTFLLTMMKMYLDLLKYDKNDGIKTYRGLFYSNNSRELFNQLNVCIEEIEKRPQIRNNIAVTRDYFRMNYQGKKCSFMRSLEKNND